MAVDGRDGGRTTGRRIGETPLTIFAQEYLPTIVRRGLAAGAVGATLAFAGPVAAQPADAPVSFADLAERLSPAVVNITTTQVIARRDQDRPVVPPGSPFEDFFRNFRNPRRNQPQRATALGSGFIISEDGYIVTNNHVIEKADEITIEFFSGKTLKAELVGRDPKVDIALLKVESKEPLPFVKFGNSDLARVGDWVLAIGNPLGQGFSVSAGIISARNRALRGNYDDYIQTDAAINRGNSGGPLFNMKGEVIGVNTAILSPNGGSIGIGFSMASNVVAGVVEQLKKYGETRRGWLGVRIQTVDESMAEALGLDRARGALVAEVTADSPAEKGGVKAGDVIVTFDGREVDEMRDLPRMVAETEVGKEVDVEVFRDGESVTLKVTLGLLEEGEVPARDRPRAPEEPQPDVELMGLTLTTLSPEARDSLNLGEDATGVLVADVDPDSEAFEKGMRPGDLVLEVNQQQVRRPRDAERRVEAAREAGRNSVLFLVQRDGEPRFVALSLDKG
ncbi:MAG: DegQ family serine endoprotease [Alphaproteobacteria bacterium]|nr:MAG: DegQ family serine endoprotease [Alphaproteobacteria bacterium]